MMKKTLLGFASVIASTSLAHAQPSLVASTDTSPQLSYVQGGVTAGADDIVGLYAAFTLEGGFRLGDSPLWAHAMMLTGKGSGIDEATYSSSMLQLRGGIEAHGCVVSAVCAFMGVDAGVRNETLMAEYDNRHATDAIVAPRAGLDIGTRHFRFRPGLEMQLDHTGWAGAGLTAAVAYQW